MTAVILVREPAETASHPPSVFSSAKEALASGGLEKKAVDGPWAKPGRERVWKP
jgi:hypothetical protein